MGCWKGDGNSGLHQQGSVVPGVEEIIADMTSHSMQDHIIVSGAEETIADVPSHSMQDQGVVSDAEEIIADVPSHSMRDVRRQQLTLLRQQNEKRWLHIKAQQETEKMNREREREGEGNNAGSNQQSQSVVESSVEESIVDMPGFFGGHQIPPMQQSTEQLLMAWREEEESERERERENGAGSSQQGEGVEQQHRNPYETNTNLSNPVAAPSGVPPQFHPNQQFRPTGSHKDASRRVMGGRVESHTRPQRTRGTERERHEEMAARLAEFDRLGNRSLYSDDAAWFEQVPRGSFRYP